MLHSPGDTAHHLVSASFPVRDHVKTNADVAAFDKAADCAAPDLHYEVVIAMWVLPRLGTTRGGLRRWLRHELLLKSLFFGFNFGSADRLADAEHNEFCWLYGGDPNSRDHLSHVDAFWGVGFIVTLDEESLVRSLSHQSALAVQNRQEIAHVAYDFLPQGTVVRLEDHPFRTVAD